jgi:hypothetical protein
MNHVNYCYDVCEDENQHHYHATKTRHLEAGFFGGFFAAVLINLSSLL